MESDLEKLYSGGNDSKYSKGSSSKRFTAVHNIVKQLGFNFFDLGVADIGCGPGNLVGWCQENFITPHRYLGVDVRESAIAYAEKKYPGFDFSLTSWLPGHPAWEIGLGIGLCGHKLSDNNQQNYENDFSLMQALYNNAKYCVVFTLPRFPWEKPCTMPLIRYSMNTVGECIQHMHHVNSPVIVDGVTFPHEWIIGISKVKNE